MALAWDRSHGTIGKCLDHDGRAVRLGGCGATSHEIFGCHEVFGFAGKPSRKARRRRNRPSPQLTTTEPDGSTRKEDQRYRPNGSKSRWEVTKIPWRERWKVLQGSHPHFGSRRPSSQDQGANYQWQAFRRTACWRSRPTKTIPAMEALCQTAAWERTTSDSPVSRLRGHMTAVDPTDVKRSSMPAPRDLKGPSGGARSVDLAYA
jgi:hypothetical protein